MATTKTTTATTPDPKTADPVGKSVEPQKVKTIEEEGIGVRDPYPTGDPKTPQTWAEINGLVPLGTGPLAPAEPPVT